MILRDKYKKAMDNISLTDEQKREIIKNAKKKKFDYRVIVNIAACLVVIAVVYGALQNKIEPDSPNKYSTDSVVMETTEKNGEITTDNQANAQTVTENTTKIANKSVEKNTEITTAKKIYERNAVVEKKGNSTTLQSTETKNVETEAVTEKNTQGNKIYMARPDDDSDVSEQGINNAEDQPMLKVASSPYIDYNSVDELKENITINAKIPNTINNYKSFAYSLAFSSMAEVQYSNGSNNIIYRLEKGETFEDISEDYNSYTNVQKIVVNNIEIGIKGNEDTYNIAVWYKNGINYSISSEQGLKKEDIKNIINEII